MPGRLTPLVTGEIYHVFNRGIDRRPTFTTKWDYRRAIETITLYQYENPPIRLSKFFTLSSDRREEIMNKLKRREKLIEIFSYCLMPNHFHFLLKQHRENGIAKFMSNFQNSYTRYFNVRHQRDGSLFLDQFKGVRIETDEQCLHVSRYIHLNPYTSHVVGTFEDLESYLWSSLPVYLKEATDSFIKTDLLLSFFKAKKDYKKFILDQADYQRSLKKVEHLVYE